MYKLKEITKKEKTLFNRAGIDMESKYFKRHYRRGLLKKVDLDYVNEIDIYFNEHFNNSIDPVTHIAYSNLTGKKDVRIIPQYLYRNVILGVLNDNPMTDMYRDKSFYDLFFDTPNQVKNIVKRTRGQYYNSTNKMIDKSDIMNLLNQVSHEFIIKPSDTNDGVGIMKIFVKDNIITDGVKEISIDDLVESYGYNFVIQKVVKQHEIMAKPHPSSVNTLRMVTIRWDNEIRNLYTFARFGHSNNVKDNAGSGGVVVGIKDNGKFMDYGIQRSKVVYKHPTTQFKISNFGIVPNYEDAKLFVRELHENMTLHNYVAWDIAISENGTPILIEPNFFGGSWVNQIALEQPMFGEHTEEILNYVSNQKNKVNELNVKSLAEKQRVRYNKSSRKQSKELFKVKRNLKRKNNKLNHKREQLYISQSKIKEMRNSRSWRYTSLFRRK